MRISVKLAPTFTYPELEEFWRSADRLGFEAIWNYDHFYGLVDNAKPTHEGWTTLAAMAVVIRQARVGCMVTGVTYRNPAILAKMAVTVDHISGGRLEFGIGAGWHEDEHRGYGIEFPRPGVRVAMVDEALTVIRRLWTEESVTFAGAHDLGDHRTVVQRQSGHHPGQCEVLRRKRVVERKEKISEDHHDQHRYSPEELDDHRARPANRGIR